MLAPVAAARGPAMSFGQKKRGEVFHWGARRPGSSSKIMTTGDAAKQRFVRLLPEPPFAAIAMGGARWPRQKTFFQAAGTCSLLRRFRSTLFILRARKTTRSICIWQLVAVVSSGTHPVGLHLVHTTISETSSGTQDGSVELHLLRGTARSNRISGTRDGSVEPHLVIWYAGRLGRTASGTQDDSVELHLVRRTLT